MGGDGRAQPAHSGGVRIAGRHVPADAAPPGARFRRRGAAPAAGAGAPGGAPCAHISGAVKCEPWNFALRRHGNLLLEGQDSMVFCIRGRDLSKMACISTNSHG